MSRQEKRLQKIRNNPKNVRFEDLQTVLISYGFTVRRKGSSHFVFTQRIGEQYLLVNIPYKKPHINQTYVKQTLAEIDKVIELTKEDDNE